MFYVFLRFRFRFNDLGYFWDVLHMFWGVGRATFFPKMHFSIFLRFFSFWVPFLMFLSFFDLILSLFDLILTLFDLVLIFFDLIWIIYTFSGLPTGLGAQARDPGPRPGPWQGGYRPPAPPLWAFGHSRHSDHVTGLKMLLKKRIYVRKLYIFNFNI